MTKKEVATMMCTENTVILKWDDRMPDGGTFIEVYRTKEGYFVEVSHDTAGPFDSLEAACRHPAYTDPASDWVG